MQFSCRKAAKPLGARLPWIASVKKRGYKAAISDDFSGIGARRNPHKRSVYAGFDGVNPVKFELSTPFNMHEYRHRKRPLTFVDGLSDGWSEIIGLEET